MTVQTVQTVFGSMIFTIFLFLSSLVLVSIEKIYQTLKTVVDSTSKLVKNTPLRIVFSTLFSVFGNVVRHGLWCLIYDLQILEYTL